jgi:glycosyltransferase involved in cell wall biosynthesis
MIKVFLETHNINNPYSGFGQFILHLLKGLYNCKDPDIKFTVHTRDKSFLKNLFGNFYEYQYYFGMRRYSYVRLRKKYDVWHSINQNTKIEPYYDMPYVLTIHDVNFIEEVSDDLMHPRNILFKEKLARANAITYISEFAKKSTHQYFDVPNVPEYVIYNGNPCLEKLDLKDFQPQIDCKGKYFFAIGDFLERKNFHLLVEVLSYLKDYKLIIAGNNNRLYAEVVKAKIEVLELQDRVILAGKVSEEEKQYHLQNCTALLFPSSREGFGLPPIEAMRFGTPVFLANSTSLPEIGGTHAFYWGDFNPKNMAKKIEEGLNTFESNKEEYQKELIKQALSFNWDTAAKKYIEVYKNLLNL